MTLCHYNSQLLDLEWAGQLVNQHERKTDKNGNTALILLFMGKAEKTKFYSEGFKLLWEREKGINEATLKTKMKILPALKDMVVAAVADAVTYY